MTHSILLAALLAAGPAVSVQRLDETAAAGELASIADDSVSLTSAAGDTQQIPLVDLSSLQFPDVEVPSPHADPPAATVTLADGSEFACTGVTVSQQSAKLTCEGAGELTVPLSQLRSVRLGDPATVGERWEELQQRDNTADLVVVRKGEVLDFVEASVGELGKETISFLLGERSMNVPREKAFGIIYARRPEASTRPLAQVYAGRSALQAAKLAFQEGKFQVELAGGVTASLPSDQVHRIDFSGRIRALDEMDAVVEYPQGIDDLDRIWHFRKGTASNGAPLRIGADEIYATRGLWMHSGVSARWRINRDYRRLTALVGMDRNVDGAKSVKLVILGDGKPLFEEVIAASDSARELDVDVTGIRDLEIRVERLPEIVARDPFGTQEHLDLGNIRLVR
jgi:hypothetical protein